MKDSAVWRCGQPLPRTFLGQGFGEHSLHEGPSQGSPYVEVTTQETQIWKFDALVIGRWYSLHVMNLGMP